MRGKRVITGCLVLGLGMTPMIMLAPGCGANAFLGLQDYQRDLLFGGLAALILGNTPAGGGGIDCWDVNGNGVNDPSEDTNGDGMFNALDCVANAGQVLPQNGISCWDLNENGVADPEEDANGDGVIDTLDCKGPAGVDGAAGSPGANGLACWDLNGNGVRDPSEDRNGDGVFDARDCHGADGASGANGGNGANGADGPEFFDIWVDDFFALDPFQTASVDPFLPVGVVRIDEPLLQFAEESPIAYRVAIPPTYENGNDVTMRLFFYRTGFSEGNCFVLTVDARRLRNASGSEVYGDDCSGDVPLDCGRRWVRVNERGGVAGEIVDEGVLIVIDLPLNTANGLNLERDLTGADRLAAGDFLAFEINKSSKSEDDRSYQVLGVEFFESAAGSAALDGATVFFSRDDDPCIQNDCQPNGIEDSADIADCPENDPSCQDCNLNGIPDECDIRDCPADDASCQDCNDNGVPDGCDLCGDQGGPRVAAAGAVAGSAQPFTFLHAGFTQELYATSSGFMGGVAFAPDGDVLVTNCGTDGQGSGGIIRRFDAQTTTVVNGSPVHPLVASATSDVGCGLTNHPDGTLYSNTVNGVTNLNVDTGAVLPGTLGSTGNALGIAADPQTDEVVYVAGDCGILSMTGSCSVLAIDPVTETSRTFASLSGTDVQGVDGIFFDPTGDFLFLATRAPAWRLTILDRSGALVQNIPLSSEPDGVAFHATSPKFVVTVNLDGTLTRLDFPNGDFTQAPTSSVFASGGFRGDLSQVASDGCLYLTQDGTRFADGTESGDNSLVRICGDFSPPVPGAIQLDPQTAMAFVGDSHTVTATVHTINGDPLSGATVTFDVFSGPNSGTTGTGTSDANGTADFTYTGVGGPGTDRIQTSFDDEGTTRFSNIVTVDWLAIDCSQDCNADGIPDECELIGNDCNENGIPDDCDGGCPECLSNIDCDDGDPCTRDFCDGGCFNEPLCPEGFCDAGQCVECLTDGDCPVGDICIDGFCDPGK